MKKIILAIALVIAMSGTVHALEARDMKPIHFLHGVLFITTDQLNEEYDDRKSFYDIYIQGIFEGVNPILSWSSAICLPKELSNEQIPPLVIKFLKFHPNWLEGSITNLMVHALMEEYPCKK